jgi:hypothetical protein
MTGVAVAVAVVLLTVLFLLFQAHLIPLQLVAVVMVALINLQDMALIQS